MYPLEKLLAPVNPGHPCGEDLAFSPEMDAIAKARQADDPSLEQGAWVTTLKEADWKFVTTRCEKLIETRSKDLRLAVWLAEALAKTRGFAGLADGLHLVAGLCERYWDLVYPTPDEDGFEQRIGNLCWIAARVPQLAREMAVTDGAGKGYSMLDFEVARTRAAGETGPDMEAARRGTSKGFYTALLDDCGHCLTALAALEKVVDARLGADGPSFTAARTGVQNVIDFVTPSARESGALGAEEGAGALEVVSVGGGVAAPQAAAGGAHGRAQALAQLRAVAEFFRSTEPHSPVAYLADKAATWGELPLHEWLRSVVKDQAVCGQLDELLGVKVTE